MGGRQDFVEVMEFLYQRKLQIPIDTVAPLADGIKMIQRLESGQQFGKIVLKP
jgi:NADPH:quinone reductase-like Zn-dependent oxidoreductase